MYYRKCEFCGANLDPGEDCDCEIELRRRKKVRSRYYKDIFDYMKEMEGLYNGDTVRING